VFRNVAITDIQFTTQADLVQQVFGASQQHLEQVPWGGSVTNNLQSGLVWNRKPAPQHCSNRQSAVAALTAAGLGNSCQMHWVANHLYPRASGWKNGGWLG